MKKLITILCFLAVVTIVFFSLFTVTRMDSPSMEPAIHRGDFLLAARFFRAASLRPGQLVIVQIPTERGSVSTVRQIQEVTSDGRYQLTASAQSGIDSRQFGALTAESIRARVLRVIPGGS